MAIDVVLPRLNSYNILSSFRKINCEVFRMIDLKNKVHDIAVDFHDISYYGTRDTPCIRGIKPKNGTSWGYSFCTLDIIGNSKLTLDVIDINGLSKDYSTLMESLFERIEKMGVKVGTLYMQYFTNWIEKSFSFIPISKYFSLNF